MQGKFRRLRRMILLSERTPLLQVHQELQGNRDPTRTRLLPVYPKMRPSRGAIVCHSGSLTPMGPNVCATISVLLSWPGSTRASGLSWNFLPTE